MRVRTCYCVVLGVLASAVSLPIVAGAQAPIYLSQWGSYGTGPGQFNTPAAVALDASGNVYVVDYGNSRIQKFTSSGAYVTQWGGYGTGNGEFRYPLGMGLDASGNVYVADYYNHRIQKFTSSGSYISQWDGGFLFPLGVAADASSNIYVADSNHHRIQKFTSDGTYLAEWGTFGSGNGQFNLPQFVAVDTSGDVYVADTNNNRIQKFTSDGTYLAQWGTFGSGNGQFNGPGAVAVDRYGEVFVGDDSRIQVFTTSGVYVTQWGPSGSGGIAVDTSGNLYMSAADNQIQKFGPENMGPPTPASVSGSMASGIATLFWPAVVAWDFDHYAIYRGLEPLPPTDAAHRVGTTSATGYTDSPGYFANYRVTSVDFHGNESQGTSFVPLNSVDVNGRPAPQALTVGSPTPSPMAHKMSMSLGLPRPMTATVEVLDAQGRLVRRLCGGEQSAGWLTLTWDARASDGHLSDAGIYFVRVRTPMGEGIKRLVLIP